MPPYICAFHHTIIQSADYIWFATDHGLIRYNKSQDEWNTFSSQNGLAGNNIRDFGIEEGIIWVATENGISNADIRLNDWRSYSDSVLPSKSINCISFSSDFAWIGTDKGLARFDKLLDEWKTYSTSDGLSADLINDIEIVGGTAWIATSDGISRLEIDYDKWTPVDIVLPSRNVIQTLSLGDYIWFVTYEGLVRYDRKLTSWKIYSKSDGIISFRINDIAIDGNNIWLLTQDGVSIYNSTSDSWSEGVMYNTMLPGRNVSGLAFDGNIIWFATDKGVSGYDRINGSWRHFTINDGLLDNLCRNIFVSGLVFVVTEKGISYYDKKTQDWNDYEFIEKPGEGKYREDKIFRIDEKGIGLDVSKDAQLRLSGISSLESNNTSKIEPERQDNYNWDAQNNIVLKGTIPKGRSIAGFYDDLRDDVEYGLTYHGNERDLVSEATGGKFEAKMRNAELVDDLNILGVGANLKKSFDKTSLYFEPRYGEQTGYFETDFLTYRIGTEIYQLEHANIIPETEMIIADMEILQRGVDYVMIYPSGWLVFPNEELIDDGEYIEVRYQYKLDDRDENEQAGLMTAGLNIDNNHYIGVDAMHKDSLDLLSLNEESKNLKLGSLSMRIKPEIAYSKSIDESSVEETGIASSIGFVGTAPRTQVKFDYAGYGQGFHTTSVPKNRFGELERSIKAFSKFDIAQWLPLTLRWQNEKSDQAFFSKESLKNTLANSFSVTENIGKLNLALSKRLYPTIAITGRGKRADNQMGDKQQQASMRFDFQYDLPQSLISNIHIKKAEITSYYSFSDMMSEFAIDEGKYKSHASYMKLKLNPIERFDLSASYKSNESIDKMLYDEYYQLRDDLKRLLIESNFSSLKGVISDFHFDDIHSQTRSEENILVKNKNTYMTTGINLIPGAWIDSLRMLTFLGRYSYLQQTVPTDSSQTADSDSRSLRFQINLNPSSNFICTGIYSGVKSWISDLNIMNYHCPAKYEHKCRTEAEFRPNSKSRILIEYDQDNEIESNIKKSSYSPSLFYEAGIYQRWTMKLRGIYNIYETKEDQVILEKGSALIPSLTFRYINSELSYGGRIYLTQTSSVSIDRSERNGKDFSSKTYDCSLRAEWKISRSLSLRGKTGISYKNSESILDEVLINLYLRMTARF